MKILLSEPLCPREAIWGKFEKGAGSNTFSYGLASIASYCIKNGFKDIKFIEPQIEKLTKKDYEEFLKQNGFDVIGLTSCTATMDFVTSTIKLIKQTLPNSKVILGGVHATLLPEETLKECEDLDIICMGEGEITFLKILENIKNLSKVKGIAYRKDKEIIINEPRELIRDINILPLPAYNLFPMDEYKTQVTIAKVFPTKTMLVSRGCVYNCGFCNACAVHGRKVRYKDPKRVVEEMLYLKNNFNTKGIAFFDSTFTVNKQWVNDFCDLIVKKGLGLPWSCYSRTDTVDEELLQKMKASGCWGITFGIESGNQKTLDSIEKGVTVEQNTKAVNLALKLGYFVSANYIICWPRENKKDALNTIKYAKKLATHLALFYLPIPFPKTKLYKLCEEDGGLNKEARWSDFNGYNFDNPVYVNPRVGKKEMQKLYNYAYRTYYITPKVLWRNLKELKSKDAFKKYFYATRCFLKI